MKLTPLSACLAVATIAFCMTGCTHAPQPVQAATAPTLAPEKPAAPPIQVPPASVLKAQAETMAQIQTEAPATEPKPEEQPRNQRPERRRNTQPQPAKPATAPPPVQTASVAPAVPEDVIGQLSTGGDSSTQNRKQTEDLISGLQKRLDAMPANLAQRHRLSLDQVRDFLRKATDAMRSGDIDGANNLAVKAKLLLDDLKN